MGTQSQIDLSAGLVPAPHPKTDIDLSAGLVPADSVTNAPAQPQLSEGWFHGSDSPEAVAAAKAANPPMQQLKEAGIGAAKSAGQTGSLILDYLNGGSSSVALHATGIESPNREKLDNALTLKGENEKAGAMVEQLAEFMLGDLGAAKGIAATSKLGMVQDALKLAEKYPAMGKLLHAGMTFLKQGSTATGIGLIHGEDLPTAAKQGAAVGALGGTADALSSLAPDAIATVKGAVKKLSPDSIQPTLQQGIRDVARRAISQGGQIANDTDAFHQALSEIGNGKDFGSLEADEQSRVLQRAQALKAANGSFATLPEPKPTASIRDVVENAADQVYARSKGLYAQLDQATSGQFQRFDEQLQNLNRKLRETAGLDDEKETELLKKRADVEAAQQKVFEDAKVKGVDPKLVDQAKADYKRAQALYDLDLNVKKSVSGMRPDVGDVKQAAKNPETVDPKKLFGRINNLYDSGRLQEALGEQGADNLLSHVNENLVRHKTILRNQAIAKTAARYAGYGVAGAAGGTVAKHLIE